MEKGGQWYPLAVITFEFPVDRNLGECQSQCKGGYKEEHLPVIRTGLLICTQFLPFLILWSYTETIPQSLVLKFGN